MRIIDFECEVRSGIQRARLRGSSNILAPALIPWFPLPNFLIDENFLVEFFQKIPFLDVLIQLFEKLIEKLNGKLIKFSINMHS